MLKLKMPEQVVTFGRFLNINDYSINQNRRNDYLILPPVNLSGLESAILEFDLYYTLLGATSASVKISTDGKTTWSDVGALDTQPGWRRSGD